MEVADFFGYDKGLINTTASTVLNQAAKRPPKTGFIIEKAERELGYKPHSFREGLALIQSQLEQR
jgi:dTDP-4-dehydrorhamnose reductase